MTREHGMFLAGGLAFGILIGFGSYHAIQTSPSLAHGPAEGASIPAPQGPSAPTQLGPNTEGGAPMVARVNELKRMLQESPNDDQVLLKLANLYYDAAMWDQAAGYYERVAEIVPPSADLLTDLGVCYRGTGRFDEALATFDRANTLEPTHWQSLYNTVVVAAFDVNRLELANEALDAMEAIDPRPSELDQGRLDQLREMLRSAAAAQGNSS
jgi:tetratricopeptide (TPR) repeat protein